jgi:hypothetical protein
VTDQVDWAAPEVSVGPLASRGSAPLGPLLGTIQGDRTLSIDRNERAIDLAMEQLGFEGNLEFANRVRVDRSSVGDPEPVDPDSIAPSDLSQPLTPLRGPGGFPVLVSSPGGSQPRIDLAALLATLPVCPTQEESSQDIAQISALDPFKLSRPEEQASEELARTDFLTSACGLVLGASLATAPFYPDLISLVRTCIPRRARRLGQARSPRRNLLQFLTSRFNLWRG